MENYGIYIGASYGAVFLGLLYLTVRYRALNKRLQKSYKDK